MKLLHLANQLSLQKQLKDHLLGHVPSNQSYVCASVCLTDKCVAHCVCARERARSELQVWKPGTCSLAVFIPFLSVITTDETLNVECQTRRPQTSAHACKRNITKYRHIEVQKWQISVKTSLQHLWILLQTNNKIQETGSNQCRTVRERWIKLEQKHKLPLDQTMSENHWIVHKTRVTSAY